jgi:ClpX C4-type zinc finger
MSSPIADLIAESKRLKGSGALVERLRTWIGSVSESPEEIEYALGAVRTAMGLHMQDRTSEAFGNVCGFCGKSRDAVGAILVSGEDSICDDCVLLALHTLGKRRGGLRVRLLLVVMRALGLTGTRPEMLHRRCSS